MPTYPYQCTCGGEFEVIKLIADIDREEKSPCCDLVAKRTIASNFYFTGASDWNKQHYNPAFGQVVKSKAHQREILAKFKGEGKEMIEIGNEKPETIEKKFKKEREEKRAKAWAEI